MPAARKTTRSRARKTEEDPEEDTAEEAEEEEKPKRRPRLKVGDIHRVHVKFRIQGEDGPTETGMAIEKSEFHDGKLDIMPQGFPYQEADFDLPVLPKGWQFVPSGAFTHTMNAATGVARTLVIFNKYDATGKKRGSHAAYVGGEP